MIFPTSRVIIGLLLLSFTVALIWDIRYNLFVEDDD